MFASLIGKLVRRSKASEGPPVLAEPIVLASPPIAFIAGVSTRREIENHLKPGINYPAAGWQTWLVSGIRGQQWVLSAFFRDTLLVGAEHYLAKTDRLPKYVPKARGIFRLTPGDIGLGGNIKALPSHFASANAEGSMLRGAVYKEAYEAHWTGGAAFVTGNDGKIERLAVYAQIKR